MRCPSPGAPQDGEGRDLLTSAEYPVGDAVTEAGHDLIDPEQVRLLGRLVRSATRYAINSLAARRSVLEAVQGPPR